MKFKTILSMMLLSLFIIVPFANGQKMTAEQIISKHLDSIAPADKRAELKSLLAVGEVEVLNLVPRNQPYAGRVVIGSEASKLFVGMSLNAVDYQQERIAFDGSKSSVGLVRSGSRSVIGAFIQANGFIISEGLFSGTSSTSWVFLRAEERRAKISTAGTKKIDGRQTYGLSYVPRGGSDLDIKMYFDQETFRHVRTEYTRTASASMGMTIDASARQSETRIKLIEDFTDYKNIDGFTLPNKYKVSFTVSGARSTEIEWHSVFTEYAVNPKLEAGSFETGN